MAHDGAVGPDHVTEDEAVLLLDESPDLRGVHRLEYLDTVRQHTLLTGAEEHELELKTPEDEAND